MRWKRTKLSVTVAGIFGASKLTNPRRASVAPIAEWDNRLSSSMEIPSAFLGRATLIPQPLRSQSMKGNPSYPGLEIAVTSTVVIPNTSKSPSLLVK
jgi:hypothetical protein